MAAVLLISQPVFSLMLLSEKKIRNLLLIGYLSLAVPYSVYNFSIKNIYSVKSESGHLKWKFFDITSDIRPFIWLFWLFFFLFSFIYERKWIGFAFAFILLLVSYINYKNENTMGSMWCWSVNSIMIYYAGYLLLLLPFLEKKSIC